MVSNIKITLLFRIFGYSPRELEQYLRIPKWRQFNKYLKNKLPVVNNKTGSVNKLALPAYL